MEYKLLIDPSKFKGKEDCLLYHKQSLPLAAGDTWFAILASRGEMRMTYTTESGEEIYNEEIFERYLTTDELIAKAEDNGDLLVDNNSWFEVEFYVIGENGNDYVDLMADDCVVYTISEGVAKFKEYINDENFVEDFKKTIKGEQ